MIFNKDTFTDGKVTLIPDSTESLIENPGITHVNRLPARANLIPAKKAGIYFKNKEESEYLRLLCGDYKFSYKECDCLEDFYLEDTDDSDWDTIDVPSMWQYRGYGRCDYPNTCYPIPFDPPYVRAKNPVGYYRRAFNVESPADRTILHFCGVDNAFFVYLNSEFVGFSKGSRIPAEFDVTSLVKKGSNLLAVKVFTYSDATYLENQDMLLANGIFREVYLLELSKNHLWDYRVTTEYDSITVDAILGDGFDDTCEITFDLDGEKATFPVSKSVKHTFSLPDAKLWNAEHPNLYNLTITLSKGDEVIEIHSKKVGIMHTSVEGNKFLVNGKPVYIKGVNRHENNFRNGRALTVEQIESELRLIKSSNLNAIRCAHYTNHPATYEIASELGLYLMDEADIETHGAMVTGDQGYISKLPEWYPSYIDRVVRMLESNKNEACIFMWSIGNECGQGENIRNCERYIRKFDPTREIMQVQDDPIKPEFIHFRKAGYKAQSFITENYPTEGYPVIYVEYAHAMGNSPGFLEGYWDYIYENEHIAGGFVWEFKNHGFYVEDENGTPYTLYGGDFGEYCHWANFNLDGLLLSDGTPKPTWYELSEVLSPIYAKYEDGKVKLLNSNDFTNADYITLKWELCEDFNTVRSDEMKLPPFAPHTWFELSLDLEIANINKSARYFLNLHYYDGEKRLASKQFELTGERILEKHTRSIVNHQIYTQGKGLCVEGSSFKAVFENGLIASYTVDGKELISDRFEFCFYRAPTDNDGIEKFRRRYITKWNQIFLKEFRFRLSGMSVEKSNGKTEITVTGKCCPSAKNVGYEMEIRYEIYGDGTILFDIVGNPYGRMTEVIPRIGIMLPLDKGYSRARWYGRGRMQSYSDSKLSTPVGLYEADISELSFMFDYPQETGNHENTSFVTVKNRETGLTFTSTEYFSFSLHNMTLKNLTDACHSNEIVESEKNYLYIDYKMRPLGSHSCGPDPEPEFELHPHKFRFCFTLSKLLCDKDALALTRTDFGVKTEALSERYIPSETVAKALLYADCDIN
ncbi:MAG: hypothetical protein IKU43_04250 [Clostridia bacterium]|nr:hypothetical protein [Clostridia bacterium]